MEACEIVTIMDMSGSMDSIKEDAIGGFNKFLKEQKKLPGKATFTLALFNDGYELIHDGKNIQKVKKLTGETYKPDRMTALLDAIGKTLTTVKARTEKGDKVIVAILTDGLENSSTDYSREKVFKMISKLQKKRDWQFQFLAANQDAIAGAVEMGMPASAGMHFEATSLGTRSAYKTIGESVTSYRNSPTTTA
tara:strand:+ start:1529 stop:2107 length:579 start_codon:yes stop_codon:yes gene_type:complete